MSLATLLVDTKETTIFVELKTKYNKVLAGRMNSKVYGNPKSEKEERGKMKAHKPSLESMNENSTHTNQYIKGNFLRYMIRSHIQNTRNWKEKKKNFPQKSIRKIAKEIKYLRKPIKLPQANQSHMIVRYYQRSRSPNDHWGGIIALQSIHVNDQSRWKVLVITSPFDMKHQQLQRHSPFFSTKDKGLGQLFGPIATSQLRAGPNTKGKPNMTNIYQMAIRDSSRWNDQSRQMHHTAIQIFWTHFTFQ